jgi:hypothetical protein
MAHTRCSALAREYRPQWELVKSTVRSFVTPEARENWRFSLFCDWLDVPTVTPRGPRLTRKGAHVHYGVE